MHMPALKYNKKRNRKSKISCIKIDYILYFIYDHGVSVKLATFQYLLTLTPSPLRGVPIRP